MSSLLRYPTSLLPLLLYGIVFWAGSQIETSRLIKVAKLGGSGAAKNVFICNVAIHHQEISATLNCLDVGFTQHAWFYSVEGDGAVTRHYVGATAGGQRYCFGRRDLAITGQGFNDSHIHRSAGFDGGGIPTINQRNLHGDIISGPQSLSSWAYPCSAAFTWNRPKIVKVFYRKIGSTRENQGFPRVFNSVSRSSPQQVRGEENQGGQADHPPIRGAEWPGNRGAGFLLLVVAWLFFALSICFLGSWFLPLYLHWFWRVILSAASLAGAILLSGHAYDILYPRQF